MKFVAPLALLLSLSSVCFATPEVPADLCLPSSSSCSPRQIELMEQFRSVGTLPALPAHEALYQGGCYMVSSIYSPEHEHYGYIYLREQQGAFGFFGSFSFFYSENPYAGLTSADAQARHPQDSAFYVKGKSQEWWVETDSAKDWRYFIRSTSPGKVILIGQWGLRDFVICEMNQNF